MRVDGQWVLLWRDSSSLDVDFIPKEHCEASQLKQWVRIGINHDRSLSIIHKTSHNTDLDCSSPK